MHGRDGTRLGDLTEITMRQQHELALDDSEFQKLASAMHRADLDNAAQNHAHMSVDMTRNQHFPSSAVLSDQ